MCGTMPDSQVRQGVFGHQFLREVMSNLRIQLILEHRRAIEQSVYP